MVVELRPPVYPMPEKEVPKTLDRSLFVQKVSLVGVRVKPENTQKTLTAPALATEIFRPPRRKNVVPHPSGDRIVLLNALSEDQLSDEARGYAKSETLGIVEQDIVFDYDHWSSDEILRSILPRELHDGTPSGFASTGHLAHFNLNDQYLPYRYLIGQVIIDKNPNIKTVVNKLDSIGNQFRVFDMELLAGEPSYVVEHRESDCVFTFDFRAVYWNSRLQGEHQRMIGLFDKEAVVADVFAGVGPFAVPAAAKGCAVLANDLNPASASSLTLNARRNRVADTVRVSCEDGRTFIRYAPLRLQSVPLPGYKPRVSNKVATKTAHREVIAKFRGRAKPEPPTAFGPQPVDERRRSEIDHFVMNLPDMAITFLDAFRGALTPARLRARYSKMPMIHCYCFTKELEFDGAETEIRSRVAEVLGHTLGNNDEVSLTMVRSVAPKKDMYCISFRLPRYIAEDPSE